KLLVMRALLFERHALPRRGVRHAEPLKQRIEVVANLLRRVGARREIGVDLQEEVTRLVQERGQVRGAEEGDRRAAALRDERRDLAAGFLLEDVRARRVEGATVADGGLDLR